MSQAPHNNQIDYIELPVLDIPKTKAFYATVFGWKFEDTVQTTRAFPMAGYRADSPWTPLCRSKEFCW